MGVCRTSPSARKPIARLPNNFWYCETFGALWHCAGRPLVAKLVDLHDFLTMSAAANRAVDTVAAGRRVEARGGKRLSRQAWQDIRRACRLAAESERVRAVDIHGVHISLSLAPFCHGYNNGGCTSPVWQAPAANSLPAQERPPRPPNSRQRRSAKRLEKFSHGKRAAAEAALAAEAASTNAAGHSDTKYRVRRPSNRWTSRPRQAPGVSNSGFSTRLARRWLRGLGL